MYQVNARLCRLEGMVGRLAPKTSADVVVSEVNPLENLAALADPDASINAVVARGRVVVDRLGWPGPGA